MINLGLQKAFQIDVIYSILGFDARPETLWQRLVRMEEGNINVNKVYGGYDY